MLKVRIMPTLLCKEMGLVKGVRFDSWRRVGSAMQAVKVYNLGQVDELVLLDSEPRLMIADPTWQRLMSSRTNASCRSPSGAASEGSTTSGRCS